jgi:integrase
MDINAFDMPQGVEIRGKYLRIIFMYNNQRYRESIKLSPSKQNIKYCANLRTEILNKIARNEFNYIEYFPNSKTAINAGFVEHPITSTCKYYLDKLLSNYIQMKENKQISPSTLRGYKSVINGVLIPAFGKYYVKELTSGIIKDWMMNLKNTTKTIRNNLSVLRTMFLEAINDGLIEKSPIEQLDRTRVTTKVGKKSDYVAHPFNEEEKTLIINQATGQFKNLVQFGFWSGLRTSELIALKWTDVDFKRKIITIDRGKVEGEFNKTKNEYSLREMILLPKAFEALKSQLQYTKTNEFIFNNDNTNLPYSSSDVVSEKWRTMLRKMDIPYRNCYQMRHTFASTLLSNGENIMWVARQMGHANAEMILKRYGKWIPKSDNSGGTNGYKLSGSY